MKKLFLFWFFPHSVADDAFKYHTYLKGYYMGVCRNGTGVKNINQLANGAIEITIWQGGYKTKKITLNKYGRRWGWFLPHPYDLFLKLKK
jgi:hypothetical protein